MASNIQFTKESAASVPSAGDASKVRLFIDSADGRLKTKDSAGNTGTVDAFAAFPGATVSSPVVTGQVLVANEILAVGSISGAVNFDLPALSGVVDGADLFSVVDLEGSATTYAITITPNGAETINGVNAPISVLDDYGIRGLIKTSSTNWTVIYGDSSGALPHKSTHISAGSDEIDGDQLDIDWNPTNYTPTISPTEVTSVDHLTAHLAGIDANIVPLITDSIATLRLIDGPTANTDQVYQVRYHTASGDGGGGLFIWDAAETASDDDGIYILPTGHVGAGRWVRVGAKTGPYNVLWWGAGAFGASADVSSYFTAALTASAGRTLLIPPNPSGARYKVQNLPLFSDSRIVVDPDTEMYSYFTGVWEPCFVTTTSIADVEIEGGNWVNFSEVIYHNSTANTMVSCTFKNMKCAGTANPTSVGIRTTRAVDVYIWRCTFQNFKHGIWLDSTNPGHNNVINIIGCKVIGCTDHAIYAPDDSRQKSTIHIENCDLEANDKCAVYLGGNLSACSIKKNYIENNGDATWPDIMLIASGAGSINRMVTISDNHFGTNATGNLYKIQIEGATSADIHHNDFLALDGIKFCKLGCTRADDRRARVWITRNRFNDTWTGNPTAREIAFDLYNNMLEKDVVFEEDPGGPQALSGAYQEDLATPTANDVDVEFLDHALCSYGTAQTINTLSGGVLGQKLTVEFSTANTTITHAATGAGQIFLKGNSSITPTAGSFLHLYCDGTDWHEISDSSHFGNHISGGSDEIDGDQLDIDWSPTNYTPTTSPTEVTSVDHLTAHLAGIDANIVPLITDSIATLRLIDGPTANTDQAYQVRYHTASGDGGGGLFIWDSASTDADDGGIYILPTGHVGAGRWVRQYDGMVNVRWYGAPLRTVPATGSDDDSAAFTAAITNNDTVFFPNGFYACKDVVLYANKKLVFESARAVVEGVLTSDNLFIDNDVAIRNVHVEGGTFRFCNIAFYWDAAAANFSSCLFHRLNFHDCVSAFSLSQSIANIWRECRFGTDGATDGTISGDAVSLGGNTNTSYPVNQNTFVDCEFLKITGAGIKLADTAVAKRSLEVRNCWFERIDGPGVWGQTGTQKLVVNDCYFEKVGEVSGENILLDNMEESTIDSLRRPSTVIQRCNFNVASPFNYCVRQIGNATLSVRDCVMYAGHLAFLRVEGDHKNEPVFLDGVTLEDTYDYDTSIISDGGASNTRIQYRRSSTDEWSWGPVDLPVKLEAYEWWDPSDSSTVDIDTGVVEYRGKISGTALIGSSGARPTYNTPGTFASGINTLTFTSANSEVVEAVLDKAKRLSSNQPYTLVHVAKWTTGSATSRGSVCLSGDGTTTLVIGHQTSDYALHRARDTSTLVQASHAVAVSGGVEWYIADYDGVNTIGIESNTQARVTQTGASSLTAVFDTIHIGRGVSGLGYIDGELGDFIIFDRVLTVYELGLLKTWLNSRL